MIELLVLVGFVLFAVFVVGAVMLHILVGLVLLPLKLALGFMQGLVFGIFAIPLAAVGFALAMVGLSVAVALGVVALVL